jgi:hypothetical protein
MDAAAIFALIEKGLTIIGALLAAGQSAAPAIKALMGIVSGAQTGTVTADDLAKTEALLDSMIADFNTDIVP